VTRRDAPRCARCAKATRLNLTRMGALCRKCRDRLPAHLARPPVADTGPAAVLSAPADGDQYASVKQPEDHR
jgi:hypothetical protein